MFISKGNLLSLRKVLWGKLWLRRWNWSCFTRKVLKGLLDGKRGMSLLLLSDGWESGLVGWRNRRTTLEKTLAADASTPDTLKARQLLALGRRESKWVLYKKVGMSLPSPLFPSPCALNLTYPSSLTFSRHYRPSPPSLRWQLSPITTYANRIRGFPNCQSNW